MNKIQLGVEVIQTTPIILGFEGEQNHTEITFYWTVLYSQYPNAVASMKIKPPVGDVYPKVIEQDDNKVVWTVSAADMANPGSGEYQLTFTDGDEIIKTYIGTFNVMNSLTGSATPPDPVQDWIDEADEKLSEVESLIVEDETVTGATPSITAANNKRYLCGTLTSLTITPPSSGYFEVVFTSGATATTLTATGITFPDWFTVEANYKYELSVLDGMGVVAAWHTT